MQINWWQIIGLCKANVCHPCDSALSALTFIVIPVLSLWCSWMEPWIWTRDASSVQPSGSWGGGRSRTWRPLWPARDFDRRASISRRTRRTSTCERPTHLSESLSKRKFFRRGENDLKIKPNRVQMGKSLKIQRWKVTGAEKIQFSSLYAHLKKKTGFSSSHKFIQIYLVIADSHPVLNFLSCLRYLSDILL